ncbi:hypothetical protein RHSIM_Rhsim13G0020900 [Rhododendron simsii]|uniref:RING-type domain-containing protein n=1 Tax=Rhododendron simsii TaxID=118357 RepID=A0A834L6V9_RHOSS|nr:hypothetical protein RHSIM_Rhsim13G0020900 [Rhododendron simsii]
MADGGNASNLGSSTVLCQEKVLRNKRKYLAEIPVDGGSDVSSPLTEFPRYELLADQNTVSDSGSLEAQSNWPKEEQEVEGLHLADWDEPISYQLEELLSHNLSATFRSAIKKIAEQGYTEDVAKSAILRSGLYYGSKDPVSNIVDGALVFLKREKNYDASTYHIFQDLDNLVEYTILEMLHVLREVKPSLTILEAMWFLLICDLNLSLACAVEGDPLSGIFGKEASGESSSDPTLAHPKSEAKTSETVLPIPNTHSSTYVSTHSISNTQYSRSEILTYGGYGGFPNLPHPMCPFHDGKTIPTPEAIVSVIEARGKSLGLPAECVQSICQLATMDESSGSCRKGCMPNYPKRHMLHHKSFHLEKHYKGSASKGTIKAKFSTWSGPVLDEKLKPPPDSLGVNTKNASSKMSKAIGKKVSVSEKSHHHSTNTSSSLVATNKPKHKPKPKPTPSASKDIICALPSANGKVDDSLPHETKPILKPDSSHRTFDDYCAGIPYDQSLGKYVAQDEKDKLILILAPQLQILEKEVQGWTDWANKKIMQAAGRLSKDRVELKTLRQEKEETEKFTKDKQIFEENTAKRLSEMDSALANATSQVEVFNSTANRLEEENIALKKELEAARLQALGSSANLQEAFLREKEALKRAQSWDTEKVLLQEEVSVDKRKVAELQHELEKAKGFYHNTEAQRNHEEKAKEKLLIEASSIKKERKQLAYASKVEADMKSQKAENEMQKYKERIEELESKISELRLESESSKIAALRRGSINGNYGYQAAKVSKRLAVFRDNFSETIARSERECVMCLAEEMSVVFLPCAHQALCGNCNEIHEKQGMNDCPSCRTPIKKRIKVRFC